MARPTPKICRDISKGYPIFFEEVIITKTQSGEDSLPGFFGPFK
jgi:hypothetical protein